MKGVLHNEAQPLYEAGNWILLRHSEKVQKRGSSSMLRILASIKKKKKKKGRMEKFSKVGRLNSEDLQAPA